MGNPRADGVEWHHLGPVHGRCLCGGVRYRIDGPVRDVVNCFCQQCQRTSGNFVAATRCHRNDLSIDGTDNLTWYQSSPGIKRGFCHLCGGNLFWMIDDDTDMGIFAGTLNHPSQLKTVLNIYAEDANDFHLIPDIPSA